jgi:hypothetical protein
VGQKGIHIGNNSPFASTAISAIIVFQRLLE